MNLEVINYTDSFIDTVNLMVRGDRTFFSDLYYDMIAAIEDGYTMEVE